MKSPIKRSSGLDHRLLKPAARKIELVERRMFLKGAFSMGALALLSGCDLTDNEVVEKTLWTMSRFNDRAQAKLFRRTRLHRQQCLQMRQEHFA